MKTHQVSNQLSNENKSVVTSVAINPDKSLVASGSKDGTIRLWNISTINGLGTKIEIEGSRTEIAFSPDGQYMALARDQEISFVNSDKSLPTAPPIAINNPNEPSIAFSPNSRVFAVGESDGLRLWNTLSWQLIASLKYSGAILGISFTNDGKNIVSIDREGNLRQTDLIRQEYSTSSVIPHDGNIRQIAFSHDGKTLAIVDESKKTSLWSVPEQRIIGERFNMTQVEVTALAFSIDNRYLAIGDYDGSVHFWDTQKHEPKGTWLKVDGEDVRSISFSPDGKTLASGSCAKKAQLGACLIGEVNLWDWNQLKRLGEPLKGHNDFVDVLDFRPDNAVLASSSFSGDVIIWDISLESWKSRACRISNRNLTRAEYAQYINPDSAAYDNEYAKNPTCPDLPIEPIPTPTPSPTP